MQLNKIIRSQTFYILLFFLLLSVVMALQTDKFLSAGNLSNIARNASFIGIMALGQTVLIIAGDIDLAVGSTMALSGVVLAQLMKNDYSMYSAALAALAVAALVGVMHWFFVVKAKISAFVVTLATMSIGRSIAIVLSGGQTLYELGRDEEAFTTLGSSLYLGVAFPTWLLLLLTLLLSLLLSRTPLGRHLYAVGANEDAAKRVGLNISRLKLVGFLASSLSAGLAAILMTALYGSVTSAMGTGYELTVIAASVIGGASLVGGTGTALGAVLGSTLMETIRNSLVLYGVDPFWQGTFVGVFILLAVWLTLRSAQNE